MNIKTSHFSISLVLFFLILVGAGCAIQPSVPDDTKVVVWEENKIKLERLQSWNLNARVAVQLGKEGGSVSMRWRQSGDEYVIRIIPTFGRGTFELIGNSEEVTMQGADNQIFHAKDPETLMQTQLGWRVPLTGLKYWIRGLPDPAVKIKTLVLDGEARIQEISQGQWQVSYARYTQVGELRLPKKLIMHNQELRVKLVIKQWDLSS